VKKFRLLLLDANIVIEISRHELWDQIIAVMEILLKVVDGIKEAA
jgi:hypothetical protein